MNSQVFRAGGSGSGATWTSQQALDHPTTGVAAGTLIPDAADPTMTTQRVVAAS
jgi:hypothetical protein